MSSLNMVSTNGILTVGTVKQDTSLYFSKVLHTLLHITMQNGLCTEQQHGPDKQGRHILIYTSCEIQVKN